MKKSICIITIIFIVLLSLLSGSVKAAGDYSISVSSQSVKVGESVTLTIKGNDAYGEVVISATNATLSKSSVFLQNDTQTVTVTPKSAGTVAITVKPGQSGLGDSAEQPITASKSASINVTAPTPTGGTGETNNNNSNTPNTNNNSGDNNSNNNNNTTTPPEETKKSNNANLSNLGIRPNDFTGFRAGTTTYNVEVPNDVESVEVYATKADKNAKVTGTGTKTLKEGVNALAVEVTAEDGTTKKTYTINVTRKTKEEIENEENEENENAENTTETEVENTENSKGLQTLKIGDLSLDPTFKTGIYEYKVKYIGTDEKLDIEAKATDDTYKVDITGNEKLVEGENLITVLVSDEKGENVATYQITVEKNLIDYEAVAKEEERLQKERQNLIVIIGIILAVIIVGVIVFLVIRNRRNYDEEYDDDYDDENQEETAQENKEELKQKFLDNFDSNDYNNEYDNYDDYDDRRTFFKRSSNKGKRFK